MSDDRPETGPGPKEGPPEAPRRRRSLRIRLSADRTLGNIEPGFCRNPFGCRAGALPWSTSADRRQGVCNACHTIHRDKAHLLPWDEFPKSLNCCPMCWWLFGTDQNPKSDSQNLVHFPSLEEIVEAKPFKSGEKLSMRACPICGFIAGHTLEWMRKARHSKSESLEHMVLELVDSALGDNDFDMLLKTCRDFTRSCADPDHQFAGLVDQIRRLSGEDIYATHVLFGKLNRIGEHLAKERYIRYFNPITLTPDSLARK